MPGNSDQYSGIVVALKANYLVVELDARQLNNHNKIEFTDIIPLRFLCTRRSRLDHIGSLASVGDNVLVEAIDLNERRAVVCAVKPRKSWLSRPPLANATEVFVLLSVQQPEFNVNQASNFLVSAEKTGLNVSLVLTKTDLIHGNKLKEIIQRLDGWGYKALAISTITRDGIDSLVEKFRSSYLSVLCGPSGVGKSSLLNYLLPNASLPVGAVSGKLQRGRHTTRHVELFSLHKSSFIADTPGFNRPDIQAKVNQFPFLFPELRSQLENSSCKFRNCLHRDEPGCAIQKDWERYKYYRQYLEEKLSFPDQIQGD